jgi:mannose-6-phosphate isomerase-like protein (cupin superfamily)
MKPFALATAAAGLLVLPCALPAQTTPAQRPPQAAPAAKPPQTAPATRARASGASALTMNVRVTDSTGGPMGGIKVSASGPVPRAGTTDAAGQVRFLSMKPGAYRLRFEGASVITLERDVTLRAGQGAEAVDATLSPAPPPPPPPEPPKPEPAPAPRPPAGAPVSPRTVAIPEFIERNMLGSREPARTSVIACGSTSTTSVLQIREPLKDRIHSDGDELLYVVGGEGLLVLPVADVPLQAGTFSLVPRGTTHTIQRRGRSGLVLLSTLVDTPCTQNSR